MSDLCIYELEDNVWDEFGESDDHIVPPPIDEDEDKDKDKCADCGVEGESRKKARHEAIGLTGNANDAAKYAIEGNDERLMKKDTVLEKGSWSQAPDGDSVKEVTGITNNDTRLSNHSLKDDNVGSVGSELCPNDPILADSNSNSYEFPLSHISQTDNELSFYDNDGGDKETSDLLYYGWPDIGNFEDVDRMFRSCDSAFGLGSLSNDDELRWFSPSHATEGTEEVFISDLKLSCPDSEQSAPPMPNNTGPSIDDSDRKSVSICEKVSSQITDAEDLAVGDHLPLDAKSENDYQPLYEGQVIKRKQSKHHSHPIGKRKDRYSENDGFHPSRDSSKSSQVFSSPDGRQHKQNIEPAPLTYTQIHAPYMHMGFSNPSVQISVPTLPGTKFENDSYPSPSHEESSLASNQAQSKKTSHGTMSEPIARTNVKTKRVHGREDVQASFTVNVKHSDITCATAVCNPASAEKQCHQSESEIDGHSEVEGAGRAVELDSSNVQENTCLSSVLDEASPQATSLHQLQQVMEQLDIRTKLCIRDSLYRLARSAAQRHNCVNPSGGISNVGDVNGSSGADELKNTGFMDIETNTNPIDRSIAHLLFHRPSDPSVIPTNDGSSLKSHSVVHGSLLNLPMMSEKQISSEGTDNKMLRDSTK